MTSSKIKHSYDLITKPCWREVKSPTPYCSSLSPPSPPRETPRPRTHTVVEGRRRMRKTPRMDGKTGFFLLVESPSARSWSEGSRGVARWGPSSAEELSRALRVRGAAAQLKDPRVGHCRDRTPHERCCQVRLPLVWHSFFWRGSMWQHCCWHCWHFAGFLTQISTIQGYCGCYSVFCS